MRTVLLLMVVLAMVACHGDTWDHKWQRITVGMTFEEIEAVMGKAHNIRPGSPTLTGLDVNGDAVHLEWEGPLFFTTLEYQFHHNEFVWRQRPGGEDSVAYGIMWCYAVVMDNGSRRAVRLSVMPMSCYQASD
jgi:hypothetical protein